MLEFLKNIYENSGDWGTLVLIAVAVLFVAGWVMMFTVRLVKRFVIFTIIAIAVPNVFGVVGYQQELLSVRETIVERSEGIGEDVAEAMEDLPLSPIYLGLLGSVLTGAVGVAGILRASRRT